MVKKPGRSTFEIAGKRRVTVLHNPRRRFLNSKHSPSIFPCYSDASLLLEWCFWSLKIEMLCWCYHHACWMLMMCLANARMLLIWCCKLCYSTSFLAVRVCWKIVLHLSRCSEYLISVFPRSLCAEPGAAMQCAKWVLGMCWSCAKCLLRPCLRDAKYVLDKR